MKFIEITKYNPKTSRFETIGTVSLPNGTAVIEGDDPVVAEIQFGIQTLGSDKVAMPKDGLAFLEAIGDHFTNPQTGLATRIQEN